MAGIAGVIELSEPASAFIDNQRHRRPSIRNGIASLPALQAIPVRSGQRFCSHPCIS
jgi:hypothetical protein